MLQILAHSMRRLKRHAAFGAALIFLLSAVGGWSAEKVTLRDFLVRSWVREDGLPAANVEAIARTSDGYLWVGTSSGLARFDGVRFATLLAKDTPGLHDDRITTLLTSRSGDLLVGTEGGFLARRRAGSFEAIPLPPGVEGKRLTTMAEEPDGTLWVGTRGAGLLRRRNDSWEVFQGEGLPAPGASQIIVDKQGRVWAISGPRVVTFENGRWKVVGELASVTEQHLAIAASRDGGVWVATAWGGGGSMGARVFRIKDRQVEETGSYPWPQNTFHTQVRVLFEDASGRLWAGMATAGIYYLESGTPWRELGPRVSLSQILVNCLAEDDNGNLWVGLGGAQLDQVRARPVRTLHLPPEASQNVIRMACARRDGSVWVGTDGAGVFRFQDDNWRQYGTESGLRNIFIGAVFEDTATNLWVGTWNGLFRLEGERFVVALQASTGPITVRSICEDRHQDLWVGTSVGVVRRKGRDSKLFTQADGSSMGEVMAIAEDAHGRIWAAVTGRGLFRQAGEYFERVSANPWSRPAEINSLLADPDGGLWLGSLGRGLGYWKEGEGRTWSSQDGLPSDWLMDVVEDTAGNLWLPSDNGMLGCPKARLRGYLRGVTPPLLCWQLSVADGLDSRRCSGNGQPIVARAADGRLWFPNSHALAVFDPVRLPLGGSLHPPLMEETLVDGERVVLGKNEQIRVTSAARSFEFHYTSPTLQVPERLQFRFRLTGWDPDWVDAGSRRVAYYNRLPAGDYQFEVMAGGLDGTWREAAKPLHLEITPRLWERRSVQAFAAVGGLAVGAVVIWSVARARLRRRLAVVERQRALEQERSRIARDMHDELGARLTQISLISAMNAANSSDGDQVRLQSEKIASVSRDLAQTLDEMVWAVRPQNDNLENVVDYLRQMTTDLCDGSNVQCFFSMPPEVPNVEVHANVRHNLLLACREAEANVLKHSGATELRLELRLEPDALTVDVADNGVGFDESSANPNRSGLRNMRQRLAEIGGSVVWERITGGGTRVRFRMPLKMKAEIQT
jgi:ligand-binding sensor domain-containing protein/signal transduction histidine kinase